MTIFHYAIIKLEHVLDQKEKVVLLCRVQIVANSSQVSAGKGGTKRLSNTADHLSEAHQVLLVVDAARHVVLKADHSKLQIDTGKHLTDAANFVVPVECNLLDFLWDLSEVDGGLVLVSDVYAVVGVDLCELAHAATDKQRKVVENVRQQDELLGVEERRSRVIKQLGALDRDTDALHLVLTVPVLGHFFVQAFKLLSELLR